MRRARSLLSWLFNMNGVRAIFLASMLVTAVSVGDHHWWKWFLVGLFMGGFLSTLPDSNRRFF